MRFSSVSVTTLNAGGIKDSVVLDTSSYPPFNTQSPREPYWPHKTNVPGAFTIDVPRPFTEPITGIVLGLLISPVSRVILISQVREWKLREDE